MAVGRTRRQLRRRRSSEKFHKMQQNNRVRIKNPVDYIGNICRNTVSPALVHIGKHRAQVNQGMMPLRIRYHIVKLIYIAVGNDSHYFRRPHGSNFGNRFFDIFTGIYTAYLPVCSTIERIQRRIELIGGECHFKHFAFRGRGNAV